MKNNYTGDEWFDGSQLFKLQADRYIKDKNIIHKDICLQMKM